MTITLSLSNLCKQFGSNVALNKLSFELTAGEFTLLLGANGAGKSSLMRILAQLSRPDSGEVRFNGERPSAKQLKQGGFITHEPLLYSSLTVYENLSLASTLSGYGCDLHEYLALWDLKAHRNKLVSTLSRGLSFRAGLARALIHNPPFLFLDEPSASLDLQSVEILLNYLQSRKNKETVALISTHDFLRLHRIADRILVLKSGQIVYDSRNSNQGKFNAESVGSIYLNYAQ